MPAYGNEPYEGSRGTQTPDQGKGALSDGRSALERSAEPDFAGDEATQVGAAGLSGSHGSWLACGFNILVETKGLWSALGSDRQLLIPIDQR